MTEATAEKREFKSELTQILNLITHSLYSHKEIFLRELLSNASDAIDKIRFNSLENDHLLDGDRDFKIRLTADAANVLLKILEEPPAQTAIFLLTPFRDRLFATIVSRCQPVRFRALSDDEMQQCLSRLKIPADIQTSLTEMALGSPGRALHLSREEQIEAIREAENLWQALGQKSPARVLHDTGGRPRAQKPNRAEIELQIQNLLVPASRALRSGDAGAIAPVRVIQSALTQLRQNVQPGLVYDNLLLQLAKEKR